MWSSARATFVLDLQPETLSQRFQSFFSGPLGSASPGHKRHTLSLQCALHFNHFVALATGRTGLAFRTCPQDPTCRTRPTFLPFPTWTSDLRPASLNDGKSCFPSQKHRQSHERRACILPPNSHRPFTDSDAWLDLVGIDSYFTSIKWPH